jgi:hypothetical protein
VDHWSTTRGAGAADLAALRAARSLQSARRVKITALVAAVALVSSGCVTIGALSLVGTDQKAHDELDRPIWSAGCSSTACC